MDCRGAKVVSVIEIKVLRGNGTDDDPYRIAKLYYSLDGKFIAESDAQKDE